MNSQIHHLLDRPIAFQRAFVSIGAGITGALMLSQALYWTKRSEGGWFYKSQADWEVETGMTRYEQEGARKTLRGLGVLEEKRIGVPARLFYSVNTERLCALLMSSELQEMTRKTSHLDCGNSTIKDAQIPHTRSRKTSNQVSGFNTGQIAQNQQSKCTETTTETTTEIKEKMRANALRKPDEVEAQTWNDFLALRKANRAPLSETALNGIRREAAKAGVSLEIALQTCCEGPWRSFRADWYANRIAAQAGSPAPAETAYQRSARLRIAEACPELAKPAPDAADFFRIAKPMGNVVEVVAREVERNAR